MDLRKVLFIGGDPGNLASVHIRCLDIARRLGCDYLMGERAVDKIPDRYAVFVCVKPRFWPHDNLPDGLAKLARRGRVVWDIIDAVPPPENIAVYLASTRTSRALFKSFGRVEVIPHHHCNIEGLPNPRGLRQPGWIGSAHWRPKLNGVKFDFYDVKGMRREDVVAAHRHIGIGLNFRAQRSGLFPAHRREAMSEFHRVINSGIKLINCIGFGIPSISAEEPAYYEFGRGCTIYSSEKDCARWVRKLQKDDDLYAEMRRKCLRKAPQYHLDAIAEKYRKLLRSL